MILILMPRLKMVLNMTVHNEEQRLETRGNHPPRFNYGTEVLQFPGIWGYLMDNPAVSLLLQSAGSKICHSMPILIRAVITLELV